MGKGLIWYVLLLKNYLVKRSTYLIAAAMVILVLVISGISVPSAENMRVGLLCNQSKIALQMAERLSESEEGFLFMEYEEEDKLIKDVVSGNLDCGFVFDEEFDEMCKNGDTDEGISYYATSFSSKGEVLKESLCAAYLECYSQYLLADVEEDIFQKTDTHRIEKIIAKYELYLEGNDVFQMEIDYIPSETEEEKGASTVDFVRGLAGLTIFLIMFFAYGESQRSGENQVELALTQKEQVAYAFIKMLAAATIPAIVGYVLILILGQSKGIGTELVHMLIYLILCGFWVSLLGKWFKKAGDLSIWLLGMILLHVVICPIFFDFSIYVPALRWLRYLLPLGIYHVL